VHKISTYIHIYVKIGKEKRKQRGDSRLAGPGGGDFGPAAGTRRRGRASPDGPRGGETARADAASAGPCVRERGRADGVGRLTGGGGGNRPESGKIDRRRGSAMVLKGRGGGLARPDPGEHGGGTNLAGGALGGTDHEEVAGFAAA
jgi:hypothetical protein